MFDINDILNTIINGNVIDELKKIPSDSIDLIFADPPYFMQTEGSLLRAEGTVFSGVDDDWDKFESYEEYDDFCKIWLEECRRVLKPDGTIWVIGAFQNIYRIGYIMQKLDFWILNDIVWSKPNPVPNFRGTRFTNANEIMLWCSKNKKAKYTFNYKTMKHLNGGKQMRSVWDIAICTGNERIKGEDGKKIHSTQKPEKLLLNVILSSSKINDVVLDPFMGTGTTGAVAKLTKRNFIGIERESKYIKAANERINNITAGQENFIYQNRLDEKPPRVSMKMLLSKGYLELNEGFYSKNKVKLAKLTQRGFLKDKVDELSIHKMSTKVLQLKTSNGWNYWYVKRDGKLVSIDKIREAYRKKELNYEGFKRSTSINE